MVLTNYTPPTYNVIDTIAWKQHLDTEGYVVIHNVLEQHIIQEGFELFWKDWNTVSPGFVRNDPKTWSIQTAPMMFAKGIAVFNGFGQSDFMWHLRLQPAIMNLFAEAHNVPVSELITSFDGFSVFFSKKQKSPKDWWHIDQHPNNPLYTIQGAYNYLPVTEESAGFTLVPQSHNTFVPSPTAVTKDWIQIHKNKPALEANTIVANGVKLVIPANCFVLWNSKTIHANVGITPANPRDKKDAGVLNRLTCYITYVPRIRRTSTEMLDKRKTAYLQGATTSHWPEKVEVKTYPWGFGPNYIAKGFRQLVPKVTEIGTIPEERLKVI